MFKSRGAIAEGQCSAMTYIGGWPGNCTRGAVDDGLCKPHAAGKKRRDARRDQQDAQWNAEREQAAFVKAWRERFPELTWGNTWTCPLCGMAIQVNAHQGIVFPGLLTFRSEEHQKWHGQDWRGYAALADAPRADREG